jgi:hypothetical protein
MQQATERATLQREVLSAPDGVIVNPLVAPTASTVQLEQFIPVLDSIHLPASIVATHGA